RSTLAVESSLRVVETLKWLVSRLEALLYQEASTSVLPPSPRKPWRKLPLTLPSAPAWLSRRLAQSAVVLIALFFLTSSLVSSSNVQLASIVPLVTTRRLTPI